MKPRVGVLLIAACLLGPVGEAGPAKDDEPNEREILRLCRQGSYPEAIELAESALHRAELEFGPADTAVAKSAATLARIYHWQGRHEEAEFHFDRALRILRDVHGGNHPGVAIVLNDLGLIRQAQGHQASAEWHFAQALDIAERAFGFRVAGVAEILNNLASTCAAQTRYDEAEQYCRHALELLEKEADAHTFELMAVRRNLASILEMMGRDRPGTSGPESVGTTPDGE